MPKCQQDQMIVRVFRLKYLQSECGIPHKKDESYNYIEKENLKTSVRFTYEKIGIFFNETV